MTSYPSATSYWHLVAELDRAGFRPEAARVLPGFPGWGAPEQHTAYCPACHTDGALVLEPFGRTDSRAVVYCTNAARCSSHKGATRERDVHLALLAALRLSVEAPA